MFQKVLFITFFLSPVQGKMEQSLPSLVQMTVFSLTFHFLMLLKGFLLRPVDSIVEDSSILRNLLIHLLIT